MVQVWLMDNDTSDQRLEHHRDPKQFMELADLFKRTGVEYFKLDVSNYIRDGSLEQIRKDRGYSYEDEITCSKDCLPDYENTLKKMFSEHLHTDEEIRFIVDGSGYFDVRDGKTDEWIRIAVEPGDLIIIPSGIYHRFTVDTKEFIQAKRLFVGEPIWLPYNRPADEMDCRKEYLQKQAERMVVS